jgi:hypothetical protein
LTNTEIIEVKEFAQKLLNGKYYCGYNKNDEDDYRRLMMDKIRENLEVSLDMVGYNLIVSEQEKTVYIRRQDDVSGPKTNLDLTTTKLIYVLKRQFLVGVKKLENNRTVFYKWNELLSDFAPFIKKSNMKIQLIDSLWVLKDLGFVNVNTSKKEMRKQDTNGDVVVEIFPSINCICDMDVVKELEEKLNELVNNLKDMDLEGESDNE